MIDYTRSCYHEKYEFEIWFWEQTLFEFNYKINNKTKEVIYPLEGEYNGFYMIIDKYKGYFTGIYKEIEYYSEIRRTGLNLSYTSLMSGITSQLSFMYKPTETNLTSLSLSFVIDLEIDVQNFLKSYLIMHKFKYYNLNKALKGKKNFIKFDYDQYSIEFTKYFQKTKKMKISLVLKSKKKYKSLQILNITQLTEKSNIEALFKFYLKIFDEVIIVNKKMINGISDFKEKKLMKTYSSYGYWEQLDKYQNIITK